MKRQFYELVQERLDELKSLKAEKTALLGGYDSDADEHFTLAEEVEETVISTVEALA